MTGSVQSFCSTRAKRNEIQNGVKTIYPLISNTMISMEI